VDELDFLVEDLLVGVVTAEQLGLCVYDVSLISKTRRAFVPIRRIPACRRISFS
jgi:hypothetical protein